MTASKTNIAAGLFFVLIVVLVIAGLRSGFRLDTQQAAFWDICIKAVGSFVAIVGALLALQKYLDEKKDQFRIEMAERDRPLKNQRELIYGQLISATSTIANSDPASDQRKAAETHFWTLFWGPLPIVADLEVGSAVNQFHVAICDNRDDGVLLRNLSMQLARACRQSLGYADA